MPGRWGGLGHHRIQLRQTPRPPTAAHHSSGTSNADLLRQLRRDQIVDYRRDSVRGRSWHGFSMSCLDSLKGPRRICAKSLTVPTPSCLSEGYRWPPQGSAFAGYPRPAHAAGIVFALIQPPVARRPAISWARATRSCHAAQR